jgi:hypothetical protein
MINTSRAGPFPIRRASQDVSILAIATPSPMATVMIRSNSALFRRLACPVTGEEPDEARAHDRECSDLRIVGANIGRGVVRHDGDEPERAERTGEQPYRKRDLNRDGKKPDDGNGTTNEQVVAEQLAKPTDRVERQRRVIC